MKNILIVIGIIVGILGWVLFGINYFTKDQPDPKLDSKIKKIEEKIQMKKDSSSKIDIKNESLYKDIDSLDKKKLNFVKKTEFLSKRLDSLNNKDKTMIENENQMLQYIDRANDNELYEFFTKQKIN